MNVLRSTAVGLLRSFLRGGPNRRHRGVMTPKRTPRGWYKGVGCRSLGRHTRKGRYIVLKEKIPTFVVPDLTDFKLKPYVAWNTPKIKVPPPKLPENLLEVAINLSRPGLPSTTAALQAANATPAAAAAAVETK